HALTSRENLVTIEFSNSQIDSPGYQWEGTKKKVDSELNSEREKGEKAQEELKQKLQEQEKRIQEEKQRLEEEKKKFGEERQRRNKRRSYIVVFIIILSIIAIPGILAYYKEPPGTEEEI